MSDIYSAPDAVLTESREDVGQESLERGIAGDYRFAIGETLSEAWQLTRGAKATVVLAILIYVVVDLVVGALTSLIMFGSVQGMDAQHASGMGIAMTLLQNLIVMVVMLPAGAGIFMIGIHRAAGADIGVGQVFGYYHKLVPLFLTQLLMMLLIVIGYLLLIVPGIYLSVAYLLAMPLVVEKNLGPWRAMEASRKAITKRWFGVFGFWLLLCLVNLLGALALGLGLIWTLPLSVIAFGILYRSVFGVSASTAGG